MADGSRGSFEDINKVAEQRGKVSQLRPESSEGKPEQRSVEAKNVEAQKRLREQDMAIARREALRLQLGGNPGHRVLSSEQMRLNGRLGVLRSERTTLKKELLKIDARRDTDRTSRLADIESEIRLIEVRRADIGYLISLENREEIGNVTNVEAPPVPEIDILSRDRSALEQELDRTGDGIFTSLKRRRLEASIRAIDQRVRELMDDQRSEDAMAAK